MADTLGTFLSTVDVGVLFMAVVFLLVYWPFCLLKTDHGSEVFRMCRLPRQECCPVGSLEPGAKTLW